MLSLLLTFLYNLFFTVALFLISVLAFFYAVGKYRAWILSNDYSSDRLTSTQNPSATTTDRHSAAGINPRASLNAGPYATGLGLGGKGVGGVGGVGSEFPRTERVNRAPRPTTTPSVAPRRLSFSSMFSGTPNAIARAGAMTRKSGSLFTPRNPNNGPGSGSGSGSRRVTFSLTPEQQQQQLDKNATNIVRNIRPPSLFLDSPRAFDENAPLVELFPSNLSPAPLFLSSPMLDPLPPRPPPLRAPRTLRNRLSSVPNEPVSVSR